LLAASLGTTLRARRILETALQNIQASVVRAGSTFLQMQRGVRRSLRARRKFCNAVSAIASMTP
jgi:hypothetical protein